MRASSILPLKKFDGELLVYMAPIATLIAVTLDGVILPEAVTELLKTPSIYIFNEEPSNTPAI